MTTTYDWLELRNQGIQLFNDTPGAELEARILKHFADHPGRVHTLVHATARKVAAGKVHSGWAILLRDLETQPQNVQATDNAERALHLRLAETWIRNTGGYLDRESELGNALFGPQGPLADWPELWHPILELWQAERARFAKAEQEAERRALHQADTMRRLRNATTTADPAQADAHALRIANEVHRARQAAGELEYLERLAPDNDDT